MKKMIQMAALGTTLAVLASGTEAASHGKSVYERTCVACHSADGKGTFPRRTRTGWERRAPGEA